VPAGCCWPIATALGGLTKGPVVLLHLGLAALVMRLTLHEPPSPRQWLPKALATTIVGLLPLLLWALLAAHRGGDAFAHELLFKQTGERMVSSFAHRRPFWWLLAMLPVLLLPWTLSLTAWRAAKGLPRLWSEAGLRFAALWSLAVLAAFSLISGKQPHYLLPIFPALALLLARAIDDLPQGGAPQREWLLAGMLLLFALSVALISERVGSPIHSCKRWRRCCPAGWRPPSRCWRCSVCPVWIATAPHCATAWSSAA
jgi:4-amino-4-deoxy-L-arabinose transferase-like glycosyltransferase